MSGMSSCAETTGWRDCRGESGGGFLVVKGAERNFFSNCDPSKSDTAMKCAYLQGSEPWALRAATDWLATTASNKALLFYNRQAQHSSCDTEDGDTRIEDTKGCAKWVALPIFWTSFAALIFICFFLPQLLFLCWWQRKR
eukprot:2890343-Rhodomonas_salina.1